MLFFVVLAQPVIFLNLLPVCANNKFGDIMAKRVIVCFLSLCIVVSALIFRIAYINYSYSAQTDSINGGRRMPVAQSRGNIYDCNMIPLVNTVSHTVLFINPTQSALNHLKAVLTAEDFASVEINAESGKPFLLRCDGYNGSHKDVLMIDVRNRYAQDDSAVHITGYIDEDGNGASGIENAFDEVLKRFSGDVAVRYTASATGSALGGKGYEIIRNNYNSAGGIVLTLDSDIQRICENALGRSTIKKGAVVVLDINSGAVLAAASVPTFNRMNLTQSINSEDSPFLNRVLHNYSVGSVFKPLIAAAALSQGVSEDTVFECKGSINVGGVIFNCHKKAGHGKINMSEAMAVSCNCYFIELGQKIGAESILTCAAQLGLGKENELCTTIVSQAGVLPTVDEIDSLPALANLSFGQGSLLATPLQIAAVYAAFANGGNYYRPYILKSMVNSDGAVYAQYKNDEPVKVLKSDVCKKICEMLKNTVENGSGKLAMPLSGGAGGKTATAETGQYKNGEQIVHTWFAGVYPGENPKYVIVVFKEDGDVSSTDCAPVFRDIADGILCQF